MNDRVDLQRAIKREFTSYYLPDELPPRWDDSFLQTRLPRMAWASAVRLRRAAGEQRLGDLINLLEAGRADPAHPMIKAICDATLIDWTDEQEDWHVLQRLLELIIADLKGGADRV